MNPRRARLLRAGAHDSGPVVYWMHREHRARDNWSLLYALELAGKTGVSTIVAHCLDPTYPAAPEHFRFLLAGLKEISLNLKQLGIPHIQLLGDPPAEVTRLVQQVRAHALVTDFDPLRHKRRWLHTVCEAVRCPVHEVDARNVVPCFIASDKPEYAARTLRPKVHRLLPEFLEDYPELPSNRGHLDRAPAGVSWEQAEQAIAAVSAAPPRGGFVPGEKTARTALDRFIAQGLHGYGANRNDPSKNGQSGLSPWLHFGMLSSQRAALETARGEAPQEDKQAFLEELIVRRELADNFCLHRQDYDQTTCYPDWAKRTLDKHARDTRAYLYSREELESAETHDPAWNAAQKQMLRTGKMHGYMRMYWCKKILEWTTCPQEAQELAVALNDRHELDGRDPNGYAGIAWSLGGLHDRPWSERPVFGQVRYMSLEGLKKKFDMEAYVASVDALE